MIDVLPDSDMPPGQLADIAEVFIEAHRAAPWGLSVEVGTRRGGSALQFLRVLRGLYPGYRQPSLFTVDPHGFKPYNGGDPQRPLAPIYGAGEYLAMKAALAEFSNHSHFNLCSLDFFERMLGCPYWTLSEKTFVDPTQPGEFFLGEEKRMANLTFCLLDGDHSAETIAGELYRLWFSMDNGLWMNPKGTVVVDNVECDPHTIPLLEGMYRTEVRTNSIGGKWAIVRGHK